jgi:protein TonB
VTRPGFWRRPEVRRLLPVGIGIAATVVLLLTITLAPGRPRSYVSAGSREPAREKSRISESHVEMRAAPDAKAELKKTLSRGDTVTWLSAQGPWAKIQAGFSEGWVPVSAVERDSDRAIRARRGENILKFSPLPGEVARATPYLLAPFSFAPVWGTAAQGTSVKVYAADHGYYAVALPDGSLGFAASRDVDMIPADPSEPALTPGGARVVTGITVGESDDSGVPMPALLPASESSPAPGPPPPGAPTRDRQTFPVAPAVLIEKIDPEYPSAALSARAAGTVLLQVSIDAAGNVTSVDVKREAGMGMTEAAVAAVQRWRYRPATSTSGPIPSMKLVRIDFKPPS